MASASYHQRPRYDYVQVAGQPFATSGFASKWFGKLLAILKYNALGSDRVDRIAVVQHFDLVRPTKDSMYQAFVVKQSSRIQIVPINSIDQRVLLKTDFRQPSHFFVHT